MFFWFLKYLNCNCWLFWYMNSPKLVVKVNGVSYFLIFKLGDIGINSWFAKRSCL